jgi:hypothetical protein
MRCDGGSVKQEYQDAFPAIFPVRVELVLPSGSVFRERGEVSSGLQRRRAEPPGGSGLAGPAPRGPGAAGREGGSLVRL